MKKSQINFMITLEKILFILSQGFKVCSKILDFANVWQSFARFCKIICLISKIFYLVLITQENVIMQLYHAAGVTDTYQSHVRYLSLLNTNPIAVLH